MKTRVEEMPMWARIYLQCFDRPAGFDPEGLEAYLDTELGKWDRQWLMDTMMWMTSQGQKWPERPNGKTLAIAYKKRKYLDNHPPEERLQGSLQEKLCVLKNAILRATDHAARWEIVCDGIHGNPLWTQEECELCPVLEAFTLERFPDFKRPALDFSFFHEAVAVMTSDTRGDC